MDYRLLYPTDYIGSADLLGADRTLTIRKIAKEKIQTKDGKPEDKAVVWFEELRAKADKEGTKERRMVLNKTNAKTIAKLYGPEVDAWIGKRIILFPTTAQAFGETVDCIRVRPQLPPPAEKEQPK